MFGRLGLVGVTLFAGPWTTNSCSGNSAPATATVELRVVSLSPGEENTPVPDAEVCVVGTEDCQITAHDGVVALNVPIDAETSVTIRADGFHPTLSPQVAESAKPRARDISILADPVVEVLASSVGTSHSLEETGFVLVTVLRDPSDLDTAIPGVTTTLVDSEGKPYYLDHQSFPDLGLAATGQPGASGFMEMQPGVHEIELGGVTENCTRLAAWKGSDSTMVAVPVEAGFFTNTLILCGPDVAP